MVSRIAVKTSASGRGMVYALFAAGLFLLSPQGGWGERAVGSGRAGAAAVSTAVTTASAVTAGSGVTTSSASGAGLTTATTPALHVGRLQPVDEARNIRQAMDALTTVPGTDLLLGYDLSAPSGWYQLEGSVLVWHEPSPSDTHRLTLTIQDAADLRIIPDAKVNVRLVGATTDKEITTTFPLSFLWAPEFYQYAANLAVPEGTEKVDLQVRIEAPTFRRRDQTLGAFFAQPVSYVFRDVPVPAPAKPEPVPGVPTTRGLFSEGRRPYAEPTPYPGAGRAE